MKVLEPGRKQNGWAIERRCTGHGNGGGGCNAKLLVEETDLFKTYASVKDETDTFVTFQCPECGSKTDIDSVVATFHGFPASRISSLPSLGPFGINSVKGYDR